MLNALMNRLRQIQNRDEGVTALEYALIAALIAAVIIGSVQTLGTTADKTFDHIGTEPAKTPGGN
jgi:pilus assembly protein Flp/PilA